MELDKVIVFMKKEDRLKSVAAIGLDGATAILGQEAQEFGLPAYQEAIAGVQERLESVNVVDGDQPFAMVPIIGDKDLLGLIVVEKSSNGQSITAANLRTLGSFALQAAVAIRDALVHEDPSAWEDQLDEVLDLEHELDDVQQLDDLGKELEK